VKELSTALREKALKYKAVETVVNKIDKGLLIKFLQATGVKVEKKSSNMDLFLSIEQPGGRIKPD
jgi:arsenate reductase-like glutaredoxin family protein